MRQTRQLSESRRNRGDQKKVAAQRRPTPHCDKPFCEKFGKSEACTNRGLADAAVQAIAWLTSREDPPWCAFPSLRAKRASCRMDAAEFIASFLQPGKTRLDMQELARTTLTDRSVPDLLFRFSVATQAELKNVYGCWQGKHGLGAGARSMLRRAMAIRI